ncbi:MAG: hypothetical protein AB7F35_25770 [Acetobacteraceae bacterium]
MRKRALVRFALLGLAASVAVASGAGSASARNFNPTGGTIKSGGYGPICGAYKNNCGEKYTPFKKPHKPTAPKKM